MVYSELKFSSIKFWAWLVIYAFFGSLTLLFADDLSLTSQLRYQPTYQGEISLFSQWGMASLVLTPFLALLGGIGTIPEKNHIQIVSFLVSHLVSSIWIYTSKLLINTIQLSLAYFIVSVFVWLADITSYKPTTFDVIFITTFATILKAFTITCLSAVISSYIQKAIYSIIFTFSLLLMLFLVLQYNFLFSYLIFGNGSMPNLVSLVGLVGLSLLLYFVGLYRYLFSFKDESI